ncbi:hypothetical protein EJB05_07535, partial [Eragrostis curvula]
MKIKQARVAGVRRCRPGFQKLLFRLSQTDVLTFTVCCFNLHKEMFQSLEVVVLVMEHSKSLRGTFDLS